MKERTLAQIVEAFYARGDETAYVSRSGYRIRRWAYRQIAGTSRQVARELIWRGIRPGDKVLLWGNDSPEWAICFFGCVAAGVVVVPMDRTASPEFCRQVLRQTGAKLCICARELMHLVDAESTLVLETLPESLARHSADPVSIQGLKPTDAVEIVFTSGTTADPKGVILTHQNILSNLEPLEREITRYLKYERIVHPLRFLNLLPLSHVFGQFLGLFIPQILGGTVVFQDSLNPAEIIRTIKRERISILVAVPRILGSLREKLERDLKSRGAAEEFARKFESAAQLHYLRRWWRFRGVHRQFGWKFWAFISGGASLEAVTEQFWSRLGFAVIQGYGLTETTSLISLNHPMKLGRGSIGKVLPGRELKLASDGEILVRGDNVAQSYVQGPETKPVAGTDGWFHTGDIGALDDLGNLYFKGRRKNVIVTSEGMNIYPEDLEAALRRQPEIRDCAVLGLERGGNAEACAVLLLRHGRFSAAEAVQRANELLAGHQQIRRWITWPDEDFPRTSTQKPHIPALRDFVYRQLSEAQPSDSEPRMLANLIGRITGRPLGKIAQDTDLIRDLNLSSIERVELLSVLEDRFQIDVDEATFTAARTVGDLERLISGPLPGQKHMDYPGWAQKTPVKWLRLLIYYLLVWPATHLLAYPRIEGRENLAHLRGPLLFASNHVTQIDVGFILAALPLRFRHRVVVAMNGEMLQKMRHPSEQMSFFRRCIERLSYWLVVSLFNVFPLPQEAGFRESFSFAGESVDRGWSVLVFPEGKRTRDGGIDSFRTGIGILGSNLRIPVVPIRIDGLFELKKRKCKFAAPGHVRVRIGTAVSYESDADASRVALDLEKRIKAL